MHKCSQAHTKNNVQILFNAILNQSNQTWPPFWTCHIKLDHLQTKLRANQANLRDLIAVTGLVTLFGLCDLEIGAMALKNHSFVCHFIAISAFNLDLQSENAKIGSKLTFFLSPMTTKLDRWHWKTKGHLSYVSSTFMHHLVVISEFTFELQSGNA